jgi:hypothetical protein
MGVWMDRWNLQIYTQKKWPLLQFCKCKSSRHLSMFFFLPKKSAWITVVIYWFGWEKNCWVWKEIMKERVGDTLTLSFLIYWFGWLTVTHTISRSEEWASSMLLRTSCANSTQSRDPRVSSTHCDVSTCSIGLHADKRPEPPTPTLLLPLPPSHTQSRTHARQRRRGNDDDCCR